MMRKPRSYVRCLFLFSDQAQPQASRSSGLGITRGNRCPVPNPTFLQQKSFLLVTISKQPAVGIVSFSKVLIKSSKNLKI
jgi:hypothetical protein